MDRYFYHNHILGFLAESNDAVLGALARNNSFLLVNQQRKMYYNQLSKLLLQLY